VLNSNNVSKKCAWKKNDDRANPSEDATIQTTSVAAAFADFPTAIVATAGDELETFNAWGTSDQVFRADHKCLHQCFREDLI